MDQPTQESPVAWQPFTFAGVSAFAQASTGRLLLLQLTFALLASVLMVWFLHHAWFPVIHEAIGSLPAKGEIRSGSLHLQDNSPLLLAESRLLSLAVDLDHEGLARSPAHLRVEFGRSEVRLLALLGFLEVSYPANRRIAFNKEELEPWWGAWSPAILAIAALVTAAGLMLIWRLLAGLYTLPAWLIGFFCNRQVTLAGAWQLAGAALMPGAALLAGAIFLYGLGLVDLVRLLIAAALHILVGWLYLVFGVLALPKLTLDRSSSANPFQASK